MKIKLKRTLKQLLGGVLGKRYFQSFFESLLQLSLYGMNIGYQPDADKSGEIPLLKYIKNKIANDKSITLFDVGANIGGYSTLLTEIFPENSTIYSFEPSKTTFATLQSNTKDLKNIHLVNRGLSNEKKAVNLYSDRDNSGEASIYKRRLDHFNVEQTLKEVIQLGTIDDYCEENNIKTIDLLKMDVEGNELKVLDGALNMLASKRIRFIQFEFGGCNIDSRTFFQDFYYLLNKDFQLYRIVQDGLFPINHYKECYELFMTTNFLAELR